MIVLLLCFLQAIEIAPGVDATPIIQAEIDRVVSAGGGDVVLPHGRHRVTDTIHLGRGDRLVKVNLIGASEGISYINRTGTTLEAAFTDRPIVNVQGGRGTVIKGIQFIGPSAAVQSQIPVPSQDIDAYARHFPQHANQQFAGVSIDAFSGQPPAEPRYAGQYGRAHSSMVTIQSCQFRFLGCGVITKPSGGTGADNQGDYFLCNDCNFQFCQYGASINGSQTRQSTFRDCKFWDLFCGVGMGQHGTGLSGSVLVSGGSFDRVGFGVRGKQVAWANGITIENMSGEQIGTIIDVVDGSAVCQVTIDKVRFSMVEDREYRFSPWHIQSEQCVTRISNSIFRTYGTSVRPVFMVGCSTWLMMDGNTIRRASRDAKNSPLICVLPSHTATEVADGKNHAFEYVPKYVRQTRIVGRAAWVNPRTIRGSKTLHANVGECYAASMAGDRLPIVFRVVETTAAESIIEVLNCGQEVQDRAAVLAKIQRWECHVWRLQ